VKSVRQGGYFIGASSPVAYTERRSADGK